MFGYQRTRRWFERAFPMSQPALTVPNATPVESFAHRRSVRLQADRNKPAAAGHHEMGNTALAQETLRMVQLAAAHGPFRTTCLPRSLVLSTLLRRRGLNPELRFGARMEAGSFEAHAWVEVGPLALDPSIGRNQTFVPFEMRATQG